MPRIIDRYLSSQVLVSTLYAVAVLSVILVLGQIFKELLNKLVDGTLPPEAILKFIGYSFPWSLSFTVPWAMLTAVLLVFGRLSADNELISLRMAGLTLSRICAPVLVLAALASGLCFWINTRVAPHSFSEIRKATKQTLLNNPKSIFRPDVMVDELSGVFMFAEGKEGETLENFQMIQLQPENRGERARPVRYVFAREAEVEADDVVKTRQMTINLKDNFILSRTWPEEAKGDKGKSGAEEVKRRSAKEEMPTVDMLTSVVSPLSISLERAIKKASRLRVDGLTMQELTAGLKDPSFLAADGAVPPSHSAMLTGLNRRLSFSMACFILAFVGIPFGITAQRRETSSGFLLSLIVGICYFALIMLGGIWQESPEKYPQLWVWVPNVVFGILGVVMFVRLQRR